MAKQTITFVSDSSSRWFDAQGAINSNFTEIYTKTDKLNLSGTPSSGDVLTFNAGTGMYEPQAPSVGGFEQYKVRRLIRR